MFTGLSPLQILWGLAARPPRFNSPGRKDLSAPRQINHSLPVVPIESCRPQRVVYTGAMQREEPGPGQESVWDYPRPPRLEPVPERITVELGGKV